MAPKFGTSGLRGLVTELTPGLVAVDDPKPADKLTRIVGQGSDPAANAPKIGGTGIYREG